MACCPKTGRQSTDACRPGRSIMSFPIRRISASSPLVRLKRRRPCRNSASMPALSTGSPYTRNSTPQCSRSFARPSSESSRVIAPTATPSRYQALDALRAAMMFLGIYLHAAVAYSPNGGWPYKPAQLTTTLDYSMVLIHIFRMPVFYVMAGFFAALLLQRYGFRRAADNRFWRIVVPFVVGWIILYPLVMFLAALGRGGGDRALDFIVSGRFLAYAHPLHLWFLEYLIVLYLLAIVAVMGVRLALPQS